MFFFPTRKKTAPFAGIPGPRPKLLFGNAHCFIGTPPWQMKPPWLVCEQFAREFGDLTLIWLLGRPTLILNRPDLVECVLVTRTDQYYKEDPVSALQPLTPRNALFLSNGDQWRQLREHHPCNVPAASGWIEQQVPILAQQLAERTERLAEQSRSAPLDMMPHLQRVSFDMFALAIFGQLLGDQAYRDFCFMGRTGARRMQMPIQFAPPVDPRFYSARRRWNRALSEAMERVTSQPEADRRDLLGFYPRGDSPLSDEALRTLLGNLFYGGVFSVTSCIVSTLRLLDEHREIGERLDAELQTQLMAGRAVSRDMLEACPLLEHVVRESLRVQPPVPIFMRSVAPNGPAELDGHTLPAGTSIAILPWLLHRSPAQWEEPDQFLPERWAGGVAEQHPLGSGWFFPFGRGPRMCVGMDFAMAHIKLSVAMLRSQAAWEIDGHRDWRQTFFFGVMVPAGLRMRLTVRPNASKPASVVS